MKHIKREEIRGGVNTALIHSALLRRRISDGKKDWIGTSDMRRRMV